MIVNQPMSSPNGGCVHLGIHTLVETNHKESRDIENNGRVSKDLIYLFRIWMQLLFRMLTLWMAKQEFYGLPAYSNQSISNKPESH